MTADAAAGLSHQERTRVFAEALRRLEREPGNAFPCPYLEGREARHLNLLFNRLQPGFYHALMDLNFRRMGPLVYRPQCLGCRECQNLRIPVADFRPSRSQRRTLAKNLDLTIEMGRPEPTGEKHALYRRYLAARHDGSMDGSQLEFELLHATGLETREVRYRKGEQLLGVGLADLEPQALSAVYCYFDPSQPRRSLGVLNVLWMIEECRRRGIPHLYLGYWVRGCRTMSYKANFRPSEVLAADGGWSPLAP
jgi:arginine-tRNA-protein transferase